MNDLMNDFDQLLEDIDAEAQAAGPAAVAELRGFQDRFRLASQLLGLRRESKMTQKQLAKASGVQQADISRIERGEINPTTTTASRLAQALGVGFGFYREEGDVARPIEPVAAAAPERVSAYAATNSEQLIDRGNAAAKTVAGNAPKGQTNQKRSQARAKQSTRTSALARSSARSPGATSSGSTRSKPAGAKKPAPAKASGRPSSVAESGGRAASTPKATRRSTSAVEKTSPPSTGSRRAASSRATSSD